MFEHNLRKPKEEDTQKYRCVGLGEIHVHKCHYRKCYRYHQYSSKCLKNIIPKMFLTFGGIFLTITYLRE